jgi:hypothetical protein
MIVRGIQLFNVTIESRLQSLKSVFVANSFDKSFGHRVYEKGNSLSFSSTRLMGWTSSRLNLAIEIHDKKGTERGKCN